MPRANPQPIRINDVTINTAQVNIQVIRLGQRQMSISVFRQLPYKDIFDNDGNLIAAPWGWINYERLFMRKPFIYGFKESLYRCDVDTEENRKLYVKEVTIDDKNDMGIFNYATKRYDRKQLATGKWILALGEKGKDELSIGSFNSEKAAKQHLQNRTIGISILDASPQLFIAA